ncbi:MAG: YidC/Oxa1 family membrane protein insertase [Clostridiales bacterium]|nr:YidC/Oxa1 family membrane protein insertase [Clostridiales bacterium]
MVSDILNLIYQFIIGPLVLLFEFVFSVSYNAVANPGICIIILSIVMNLLALPLYRRADTVQKKEAEKMKKVAPWQERIRKTFKGDERFMMLNAYNREAGVKPSDALKGSVSLLLEIPFFIAAYRMLSSLALLNGKTFGPIKDLGAPDGLLVIGSLAINILPVLMTAINLVSSSIYLKGSDIKGKIQLYGIAAIFLVLLYNSPSGLVFYWTCNNIFSLIKNLIPFGRLPRLRLKSAKVTGVEKKVFILSGIYMSALLGMVIPSNVVKASTAEFVNMYNMINPSVYFLWSVALSAGVFVLWFGVFYSLSTDLGKHILAVVSLSLALLFTTDYFLFGREYGIMNSALYYHYADMSPDQYITVGIAVILTVVVISVALRRYVWKYVPYILVAALLSISVLGMMNIAKINKRYGELTYVENELDYATLTLSRTEKNVVVIMLDRAQGFLLPYCFSERPELEEKFDGFTFYENTVSFGRCTNIGAPALFGGYDYTPSASNARDDLSLMEKHNEALKLMPFLFDDNGFDVTVCDPSYANYKYIPDLSIYDEHPDIATYVTIGRYNEFEDDIYNEEASSWKRNFFCYSLFRVMPPFLHQLFYDGGQYNVPDFYHDHMFTPICSMTGDKSKGYVAAVLRSYSALSNITGMTQISDSSEGGFVMFVSNLAHDPGILKEPEYEPMFYVDNVEYDAAHKDRFDGLDMEGYWPLGTYQVNMASYILLGEWFDYLREEGVYDNTRIIIVADHGCELGVLPGSRNGDVTSENFNPVLLVKDFDSHGFTVSDEFMTNADTPSLAMAGLIDDPVNPFTGNPINSDPKYDLPLLIFNSYSFDTEFNNGNTYEPGPWYEMNGDVFAIDEWEYAGEW